MQKPATPFESAALIGHASENGTGLRQNERTHVMPNVNETSEQPKRRVTAESMAAKQRDISVSEFFAKNRHLLGFDNPRKDLLTGG